MVVTYQVYDDVYNHAERLKKKATFILGQRNMAQSDEKGLYLEMVEHN